MAATKSRARQFAELTERPVQGTNPIRVFLSNTSNETNLSISTDFDPEAEVPENDDSNSEESVDENAGTEHYVAVGYDHK